MNLLPVTVVGSDNAGTNVTLWTGDHLHVPGVHGLHTGAAAQLGCRPHTLRLQPPGAPRDPAFAWLPGVVEGSEFLGEFTRYRVRPDAAPAGEAAAGTPLWADLPHRTGQRRLPDGAPVAIGLDSSQARLLAG